MNDYAIEIKNLNKSYKDTNAVNNLNINVEKGKCYGFFGRNGAGKTTTIKCILNHLTPDSGEIKVFGVSPQKDEVKVKERISYVPEEVSFYPWMTIKGTLDYLASFRGKWNKEIEKQLVDRFSLNPKQKVTNLSKGMKAQLSLIAAICAESEILLLDEPTSGLDPIVRREFLEVVIGAFQDVDPENRTIFVSTHLINEFEGLIDQFTIIESGKNLLTLESELARKKYKKIFLSFSNDVPDINNKNIIKIKKQGRDAELLTNDFSEDLMNELSKLSPLSTKVENLTLEEIFVSTSLLKG